MAEGGSAQRDAATTRPSYFTGFVGREAELAELRNRLRPGHGSPAGRLTTLVGLGGSGKTRLASEAVTRLLAEADQGAGSVGAVWWVDLGSVVDPDRVAPLVTGAVLPTGPADDDPDEALRRALRDRPGLLVLDNCEQVAARCEELFATVFAGLEGLLVLATSRVELRGSHRVDVGPMVSRAAPVSGRSEACRLFYDRAALVLPAYPVLADDEDTVIAICELLGGLPLAIELAAPWVRTLSAAELLTQLAASRGLLARSSDASLTPGGSDPGRHQSIDNVLDGTWARLSGAGQRAFGNLAVFVGSFSLDAARTVGGATLETLGSLTTYAVVNRISTPDDSTRYVLHELVRRYAADRLADRPTAEVQQLHRRHLGYFVGLGDRFMAARNGPQEGAWLVRMLREAPDLAAALAWGREADEDELVLRLVADLLNVWIYSGSIDGHRAEIDAALEARWDPDSVPAATARAQVVTMTGRMVAATDPDRGRRLLQEARQLFGRLGDTDGEAGCMRSLSRLASDQGDHRGTVRWATASLTLCERAGDDLGVAWSLVHLGEEAFAVDRFADAERLILGSLAAFRAAGNPYGEQGALLDLANLNLRLARWPAAVHRYAECLEHLRAHPYTAGGRELLRGIAAVAAALGRFAAAARLFGAVEMWDRTYGGWRALAAPTAQQQARVRKGLGAATFDAELARGLGLTPDDALAEATARLDELVDLVAVRPNGLTSRELEVLTLLVGGLGNDELAERLVISPRTVHAHLRSVSRKLGVSSRTAAVREASRLGISG